MQAKNLRRLVPLLLVIGLGAFGVAAYSAVELGLVGDPRFHGTPYPGTPAAPEFTLTDHRGDRVSLEDFRGRTVLLFFGFTRCPDVCPLTLARLSRIVEDSAIGPDRVSIVMITVDPENDTPAALAEFVGRFGPSVTGVTGDPAQLEALFERYGVYARETIGHDGAVVLAHTSQVFGIDSSGRLRVLIHADDFLERVESDIRALLQVTG